MTFRALLAGCWFDHGNIIRERRGKAYLLVCDRCGSEKRILAGQKFRKRKQSKVLRIVRQQRSA